MAVDADHSIYVGGIPYDSTEDTIRRVFDFYGTIVSVKIINDRGVGGKCYSFVTFRNPRSAVDAINDMNGKEIDGRVVRVNEVNTRGGRPNFDRDGFRKRSTDRGLALNRISDRGRNYDRDRRRFQSQGRSGPRDRDHDRVRDGPRDCDGDEPRDRDHDGPRDRDNDGPQYDDYDQSQDCDHNGTQDRGQSRELDHVQSQDRDWSQDRYQGKEREHEHLLTSVNFIDRDQHQDTGLVDTKNENNVDQNQNWHKDYDLDWNQDKESDRIKNHGKISNGRKNEHSKKRNSSSFNELHNRELSLNSNDSYHDQCRAKERLESSFQRREDLQMEIFEVEEKLEDRQQHILNLQKQSQKLEAALSAAKRLLSQRKTQLSKLHKCYMEVDKYRGKLKSSELDLQGVVDTAMMEVEFESDIGLGDDDDDLAADDVM